MRTQRMGFTLLELLITVALVGILAAIAAPPVTSAMDILVVRAARESAFGLFARARVIALQHGGAIVELSAAADRITIRSMSGAIEEELQLAPQRVDLLPAGGADPVQLRYDAHGLGRMMSQTITFALGHARAGLTVSSFGRVRRW